MPDKPPIDEPGRTAAPKLALTRIECADSLGVSPRKIDELIARRRGSGFPVVYLGTKPVVPVHLLRDRLAKQAQKKGDDQ